MKKFLAIALLFAGCAGKAKPERPVGLPEIPLNKDLSIAVSTQDGGLAHACFVNGRMITAHHVVYDERTGQHVQLAWSDDFGNEGFAAIEGEYPALDLVTLQFTGQPAKSFPAGKVQRGDKVYWFEYDFRTRANALRARLRTAKVLRIVAHQIVLDNPPVAGGSGSCLFSYRKEVVGIITFSVDTGDKLGAGGVVKLPVDFYESR